MGTKGQTWSTPAKSANNKGSISQFDSSQTEVIYDVACSNGLEVNPETNRCPDNGARVDIETCAFSKDVGSAELKATWTDPEFNPNDRAFTT